MKSKLSEEGSNHNRRLSEDSYVSGSTFEQRLERKMSGRGISPGAQSSSSRGLDEIEKKLAAKSAHGNMVPSQGTPPGAQSSSSRRLDDMEARIQAKSRAGDKNRRGVSPGAQSSSSSSSHLDDFDAKIQSKMAVGGGTVEKKASTTNINDFDAKIRRKMAGGGSTRSGADSLRSNSMAKKEGGNNESFESKLEKRRAERKKAKKISRHDDERGF